MSDDRNDAIHSKEPVEDMPEEFEDLPDIETQDEIKTHYGVEQTEDEDLVPPPTIGAPAEEGELLDDSAPATIQDDDGDGAMLGEMVQLDQPSEFKKPQKRRKRTRRRRLLAGAVAVLLVGTLLGVGLIVSMPPAGEGGDETPTELADGGVVDSTNGVAAMVPGEVSRDKPTVLEGDPSNVGNTDNATDETQPEISSDEVQELKDQVTELRDSLSLEQERTEELDREMAKRGKQITELEVVRKTLENDKAELTAKLNTTVDASSVKEQKLTEELNGARDELVKLQASYEEGRAKLIDLREKFDLKERQYQARMANLEKNLQFNGEKGMKMADVMEAQRDQINILRDELERQQQGMATKYLDQAREHILKLGERRSSEEHLVLALQQFYYAGKVDPKNERKYRQMAVEVLDEQVERIRQRKGKSAQKDKQFKHYMDLRAQLIDA